MLTSERTDINNEREAKRSAHDLKKQALIRAMGYISWTAARGKPAAMDCVLLT